MIRPGHDLTIAAVSHSTIDALRTAEILAAEGIDAEVLDLRTLRPLDRSAIVECRRKTGRLLAADIGWKAFGAAAEVMAVAVEAAFASLKRPRCVSDSRTVRRRPRRRWRSTFPRVGDIVNAATTNAWPAGSAAAGSRTTRRRTCRTIDFVGRFDFIFAFPLAA